MLCIIPACSIPAGFIPDGNSFRRALLLDVQAAYHIIREGPTDIIPTGMKPAGMILQNIALLE